MKEKLEKAVERACKNLYRRDKSLLDRNVNERAILFRFGIYLQRILSRDSKLKFYDLDNEYNRNMYEVKRTENYPNGRYPDFIIHKREKNDANLIVIEFKKENTDSEDDLKKIDDFISLNSAYKYKFGMYIVFREDSILYKIKEAGNNYETKIIKM